MSAQTLIPLSLSIENFNGVMVNATCLLVGSFIQKIPHTRRARETVILYREIIQETRLA